MIRISNATSSLFPDLAIIAVDQKGAQTIVRLCDVGRALFMRRIRVFAAQASQAPDGDRPPLKVLNAAEAGKLAPSQVPLDATSGLPYASTREHLEDLKGWLDLCLHQRLIQEAGAGSEGSTPGWAMSAERARSLLGDAYASASEEELHLGRLQLEVEMMARETASRHAGRVPRLVALVDAFGLTETERRILAFVLAPELDARYGRIFGFLNDDLTRRRPTPSLMAQLALEEGQLAWDVRQLLAGDGSLATYQLVMVDPQESGAPSEVGMMLAPELVPYVMADRGDAPVYGSHLQLLQGSEATDSDTDPAAAALRTKLTAWQAAHGDAQQAPIIQLIGNSTVLRWFNRVLLSAGSAIVILDASVIDGQGVAQLLDSALGAVRAAVLHHAVLVVTGLEHLQRTVQRERIEAALVTRLRPLVGRLVVHGESPWLLPGGSAVWQVERVPPSFAARAALWRAHAQRVGYELPEQEACLLAATVRFDETEIDATLQLCSPEPGEAVPLAGIQAAARKVARTAVPSMARRIVTTFDWSDIVLPGPVLASLRQIPAHVRHAGEVFEDWGYRARLPYGRGVAALFCGPSGTGKTMAAQVIARELGVELFQVDLAKVVSKYIGETEKNLDRIFDAAERASAVLLFDEADALFGKRTEVKDAHDRYANVEIAYLLQRMESYAGLAVLTTNLKQNVDDAFLRRLRFLIDFPSPDGAHRELIWQRVFPPEAPLGDDVDLVFLARRLKLTGGHIQQIAVHAAFAAAAAGAPIGMAHILQATREGLAKLGMLNAERGLAELMPAAPWGRQERS
jgi:hypothetical protein